MSTALTPTFGIAAGKDNSRIARLKYCMKVIETGLNECHPFNGAIVYTKYKIKIAFQCFGVILKHVDSPIMGFHDLDNSQ